MLRVFICDDDPKQRERIADAVKKYALIENMDMRVALTAEDAGTLLQHLEKHPNNPAMNDFGLYFLDVDLQSDVSGIQLAAQIKALEPFAFIVFITSYAELSHLTFRYKVEALDYISKDFADEMMRRVRECLDMAYKRYQMAGTTLHGEHSSSFPLKVDGTIHMIPMGEIMFFEAHPTLDRKVTLHMRNREVDISDTLKNLTQSLPEFYLCHRSYLVNVRNVRDIDTRLGVAKMANGQTVLVSTRKMKELAERVKV